jgi:hypothetical protein
MSKKKIVIAVVGAIALLALLSGCGGGGSTDTATPTVTVTETAPADDTYDSSATDSGLTNAEDEFLYDVHGVGNSVIESNSDEQIVSVGHTICDTLGEGNTVNDVSEYLISTGDYTTDNDIEFVATMIAGSVINLCPEYKYQLP